MLAIPTEVAQLLNTIEDSYTLYNRLTNLDKNFYDTASYKLDKMGNLINTWCLLSTTDKPNISTLSNQASFIKNQINDYILLYGVTITLSKSPKVIETNIKGYDSPVFQQFTNTCFDINISYLESGPTFVQQNTKQIKGLINILDAKQSLFITNPLLNYTYNINKVVVFNYNIGQDSRFYSHTPISITLKSDKNVDIIQKTIATV